MHVVHVVGARPNLMKAAPVLRALRERTKVKQTLVHTGQHYDTNMSDVFFQQLGIPAPDVNLEAGSGTHAQQTADIMSRFEPVVLSTAPNVVLVYGDVNSTLAAALVCSKLLIRVGHVEAGLRSFDRTMPEEINRLLTDRIADLLFTTSEDADRNLEREGIARNKIYRVGNVMIDTLVRLLPKALQVRMRKLPERYALVTLHRPSNVDEGRVLKSILESLLEVSIHRDVVFPVHPRTRRRIEGVGVPATHLHLLEPLPYVEFLALQRRAAVVITDSGGVQEETTYLKVPCLTLRENTERPVTVTVGTNVLVGQDRMKLHTELAKILEGKGKPVAFRRCGTGMPVSASPRLSREFSPARGSSRPLAHRRLVRCDLPTLTVSHHCQRHRGGLSMIKLGAVLLDQGGTVPGIEAFYHGTRGIEQFAQLVWVPFPGDLHGSAASANLVDFRNRDQLALGNGHHVSCRAILLLGLTDSLDWLQKALSLGRDCDGSRRAPASCILSQLDQAGFLQQAVVRIMRLFVHAGDYHARMEVHGSRTLRLQSRYRKV